MSKQPLYHHILQRKTPLFPKTERNGHQVVSSTNGHRDGVANGVAPMDGEAELVPGRYPKYVSWSWDSI